MLTPLNNTPRDYDWGSTTLLANLRGEAPTGAPEAEVWFGDHPGCPARVADGRTLDVALADAGAAPLPYLLKLLAAGKSLSIQVHPSKEQAVEGFAAESDLAADDPTRNYLDDNHKPEIVVALSERFEALAGLRRPSDTVRLLASFGDVPEAAEVARRLCADDDGAVALRHTIAWLLSDGAAGVADALIVALPAARSEEFADELRVLGRIAETFPGDRGFVVALLMNLVTLRRGEGLFLRAGLLHTYQSGLGVELMAASDNVLRGGLTPKRVDVPELLRLVDTTPGDVPVIEAADVRGAGELRTYGPGVPDFALAIANPTADPVSVSLAGPTILLATAGTATITAGDTSVTLTPSQAALALDEPTITLSGPAELFLATPGTALPH